LPFLLAATPAAGSLNVVDLHQDGVNGVDGLEGARAVELSPDGRRVYVASEYGDSLSVFARDPATGSLTFEQALLDGVGALDVYSRNPTTGRLRLLQKLIEDENGVEGLGGLYDIALSPDGAHLYAASRDDNTLTVFRVEDDICCGDADGDGHVTIDELIAAVNNALGGCPE